MYLYIYMYVYIYIIYHHILMTSQDSLLDSNQHPTCFSRIKATRGCTTIRCWWGQTMVTCCSLTMQVGWCHLCSFSDEDPVWNIGLSELIWTHAESSFFLSINLLKIPWAVHQLGNPNRSRRPRRPRRPRRTGEFQTVLPTSPGEPRAATCVIPFSKAGCGGSRIGSSLDPVGNIDLSDILKVKIWKS
jgi:hypothetical protein